jgi:hypothetical protein
MSEGKPIAIRFPIGDEKRIRIIAIEEDRTFSATVRALCNEAIMARTATVDKPQSPTPPRRRVLSRGVI